MIVERRLGVDVVMATQQRVRNIFANKLPVYMGFSGGKDSLVLAHLVVAMIDAGEIDPRQLKVYFIDEEAIFPCVEAVVIAWRQRFLDLSATFDWYALEVRHFNCLNQLESDESFICWDRSKRDVWIRDAPDYAIRSHPLLDPRVDTYQAFLRKIHNGPNMTGLRVFESVQRRQAIAAQKEITSLAQRPTIEPIYDWQDSDVWLYLKNHEIDIPAAYLHLYQVGAPLRKLRISQFFSVDTAYVLARVSEFYPGLMERILRREPSAYIVSLYWDSEMFRRRTATRKAIEKASPTAARKAGRDEVFALLRDVNKNFKTVSARRRAVAFRRMILMNPYIKDHHFELIHDALIAGDPKGRTFRSIYSRIEHEAAFDHGAGGGHVIHPTTASARDVGQVSAARRSPSQFVQSEPSSGVKS